MANSYYDHTNFPVPNAAGTSKSMRDELDAIEQGFDKLPAFSAGVSSQVILATSTGLTTSSALNSFSINSSDITNSTLSNVSISAVGISNISATGTFYISANPTGRLLNVNFGSPNDSTGNIFATNLHGTSAYISNVQASTTTVSRTATFATHWQFRDTTLGGYLLEGSSPAQFLLGTPPNQVTLQSNGTPCTFPRLNVFHTAQFTYLRTLTGSAAPNFVIDFNTGLITELNTATTTLGAVNKGQLDTQINIVDAAKYNKTGGTVSGTALFSEQVTFGSTVNYSADINLLNNNINNVASATSGLQAVNKNQMDYRVDTAVADLVSAAPGLLDTLGELADAIGNNEDFAGSMASVHATKLTIDGSNAMTGNLNVNNNLVINVSSATASHHAVNKNQLDFQALTSNQQFSQLNSTKLNITGGSVTGNINLSATASITNAATVSAGTTSTNLSTKEYVDRKSIALQMVYSI